MTNLDELLRKYNPNGVSPVKLGDVLDYEQPSKYIVSSSEYDDNYDIPVLTAGQSFILGYTDETDGVYKASKKNPTIIFDDFTTGYHWVDFDFKVKSSAMKMLRLRDNNSLLRYVFHSMALINYVPSEHSRQWISKYSQFEIPLPHKKVQEEIVEILDSFTNLIDALNEELSLRQKQFEHYREKLLSFDEAVKIKVEDFCSLKAGKAIKANELSEKCDENHPNACFGGNGIRGYIGKCSHIGTYPIIGRQGALCGCVTLASGFFYATEHAVVVTSKKGYDNKFLYHLFKNADLNQYKSSGAQPGLAVSNLNALEFSIPPLSIQKSIVEKLDAFESLISSLKEEIALRQKQYEYYREKLLTFD